MIYDHMVSSSRRLLYMHSANIIWQCLIGFLSCSGNVRFDSQNATYVLAPETLWEVRRCVCGMLCMFLGACWSAWGGQDLVLKSVRRIKRKIIEDCVWFFWSIVLRFWNFELLMKRRNWKFGENWGHFIAMPAWLWVKALRCVTFAHQGHYRYIAKPLSQRLHLMNVNHIYQTRRKIRRPYKYFWMWTGAISSVASSSKPPTENWKGKSKDWQIFGEGIKLVAISHPHSHVICE
jgi:hypothetical protein